MAEKEQMSDLWYHEPQEESTLEIVHAQLNCLFCNQPLSRDVKAEQELQYGYGYDVIAPAVGYSGINMEASVSICRVCGWWKYTQLMNMPGRSGFEDFFNGGYGVLKQLDVSDIGIPVSEVRSYLAAKYDTRFKIHPMKFEDVVASVFKDLGYRSRVTAYSGDDGIDVILDAPNGDIIGVQVKRYSGKINIDQIRALTGALFIGGYTRGVFVTTSSFQSGGDRTVGLSARRGLPVELVDADRFYDALKIAQIKSYTDVSVTRPWATLAEKAIKKHD